MWPVPNGVVVDSCCCLVVEDIPGFAPLGTRRAKVSVTIAHRNATTMWFGEIDNVLDS